MLDALDQTIETLLRRQLPNRLVGEGATTPVSITFVMPDPESIQKISLPAINLFLYDIRENLELRSNDWRVTRQDNRKAVRERPPIRVDCSYLITAWPSDASDIRTEHQLLGAVMEALYRHPRIPEAFFQGRLRDYPSLMQTHTSRPTNLQSMGEYWQAVGGKPKATLNYTVTMSFTTQNEEIELPLAIETGQ